MAFDLDDLIACLHSGDNLDIGYHRVFGGQILAKIITAASDASPDKSVKSIQVQFPTERDTTKPSALAGSLRQGLEHGHQRSPPM